MTRDAFDGYDGYYTVNVEITDLSYDPDTGKLFGLLNGLYDDQMGIYEIYSGLVEINLEPGRLNLYTYEEMEVGEIINIASYDSSNGRYRPGNLLVKDGYAYSVDTWISGILNRVSLMQDPWMDMIYAGDPEQIAHVGLTEWGMYFDSRSFVYDPLFDTTYVLHDLGFDYMGNPRSDVTLYTIDLGNTSLKQVCSLGRGIVLNSLIIL